MPLINYNVLTPLFPLILSAIRYVWVVLRTFEFLQSESTNHFGPAPFHCYTDAVSNLAAVMWPNAPYATARHSAAETLPGEFSDCGLRVMRSSQHGTLRPSSRFLIHSLSTFNRAVFRLFT